MDMKLLSISVVLMSLSLTHATALELGSDSDIRPRIFIKSSQMHCLLINGRLRTSMPLLMHRDTDITHHLVQHFIFPSHSLPLLSITSPILSINTHTPPHFMKIHQATQIMYLPSHLNENKKGNLIKAEQITCHKSNFRPYCNENSQQNYQNI